MTKHSSAVPVPRPGLAVPWISVLGLATGLVLGFLQPVLLVGVGAGLYAGPTYVGLLFLLCLATVLLAGFVALVVRSSRSITVPFVALSGCLALGILGGNGIASALELSFAAPPPPVTVNPTGEGWSVTGDLLEARSHHTATLLTDGRVLVAGGRAENPLASAELYDPPSGTWTATGSMVWPVSEHVATLLGDGRVLVTSWSGRAQLYDPASGTWGAAGDMAHRRTAYRATLLSDGRVLVTGGRGPSDGPMSSVELFDPSSGNWVDGATMLEPRTGHTATLLADGRVLVAGGQGPETSATNQMGFLSSAEIYDPESETWTAADAMNVPHFGHAALLLDDGVVLVTGSIATPVSERFDPLAGSWLPTADTGSAVGPSAALLADGRVLVTDGTTGLDVYDLQLAARRSATTGHGFGASATLLPDDRVLVAGGVIMHYPGPGDVLAAAHLYDPR